jgi:putative FmdB family regulatory protein
MPTFDFQCEKCGNVFEDSIAFGAKTFPSCPACGGKKIEKLLAPPLGIHFKGSGFYKTDSQKKESAGGETSKKEQPKKTSDGAKKE